ncbi:MAG: DUF488 domain-containing protein [Rickettsiales bacterium]|nr:MAG: DUF488 domain-containing protein [Rickettsiales bacterium]
MSSLYTIGYTAFSDLNIFTDVLKSHDISVLIDVRSVPKSKYYIDYDSDLLDKELKKSDIIYRNYATEFGARQVDFLDDKIKCVNFENFINSKQFKDGIEKVEKIQSKGRNIAFMCAEKDPITCHRSIMVGKGLLDDNFQINHIMTDKTIKTQQEITNILLEKYKNDLNDFLNPIIDPIKYVYLQQNKKIGFTINEEE